ncbi:MAG: PAS domain S-box protein [Campylobacteraceae bacterium]|nr:PAS domain S-box protein [Campylobacteraceae bacterium]
MKQKYSLKKLIFFITIFFTVFIPVVIVFLTIWNLYTSKVDILIHNQKQVLQQVNLEASEFLEEVGNISQYIRFNYPHNNLVIKSIVDINENISTVIILDEQGIISDFYSQEDLHIFKGFDYSNKQYFKEISEGKASFWSDLFLSTINENQSLSYSFRMNNQVAVIFIELSDLSSFVKGFKNSDGSHMIRIYDDKGTLILNPDKPYLQEQRINVSSQSVFLDLIRKVKPFEQARFNKLNSNQTDYGMYLTLEKTGWHIVTRENYDAILNDLKNIVIGIILIVLVFIILSLFFILRIFKRFFTSLEDLEHTTSSIASGRYNTKIEDSYFNEFNELINSFKNMQHEIKKREISLQKSVESFEGMLNSTMEGILLHEDGICIDVNEVAVNLLGFKSKDEILGQEVLNFVAPTSSMVVKSKMLINYEPYEIEMMKNDGTQFEALVQGKFIEVNNKIAKVFAIIDITEVKEKDKLLFQQSKMASMGEMIGNIAHQWRQPLSTISTASSGMKFQKEFGELSDEDFISCIDAIVKSTKYLSSTIDDFRNFFNADKEMNRFNLHDAIEKSLTLMESSIKSNYINIVKDIDREIFVFGYKNEFIQAYMNILSNSKDAFLNKNIDDENKVIFVSVKKTDEKVLIVIKDNAGGIANDIIGKICEPYFTTKHKSQGTGIGLYMTHQIISQHMHGELKVANEVFEYKGKEYKGAKFIISLKIDKIQ